MKEKTRIAPKVLSSDGRGVCPGVGKLDKDIFRIRGSEKAMSGNDHPTSQGCYMGYNHRTTVMMPNQPSALRFLEGGS